MFHISEQIQPEMHRAIGDKQTPGNMGDFYTRAKFSRDLNPYLQEQRLSPWDRMCPGLAYPVSFWGLSTRGGGGGDIASMRGWERQEGDDQSALVTDHILPAGGSLGVQEGWLQESLGYKNPRIINPLYRTSQYLHKTYTHLSSLITHLPLYI